MIFTPTSFPYNCSFHSISFLSLLHSWKNMCEIIIWWLFAFIRYFLHGKRRKNHSIFSFQSACCRTYIPLYEIVWRESYYSKYIICLLHLISISAISTTLRSADIGKKNNRHNEMLHCRISFHVVHFADVILLLIHRRHTTSIFQLL